MLCNSLDIFAHREARLLLETVLVNPEAVAKYIEPFAAMVTDPPAKDWFRKKLRAYLINDPTLLQQVTDQNSRFPDYANTALANGVPVYQFDAKHAGLAPLRNKFQHIADWFNAMHHVSTRVPANQVEQNDQVISEREYAKIMKYSPDVAYQRADEWFRLMGTRVTGEKTGVDVVKVWPDGYYVVTYTDANTMKIDGNDLQNCLRYGNYWEDVEDGSNAVYGIRKPTDEAVVGIRVQLGKNPMVVECKGKNNEPVINAYRPYVISFLTDLHIPPQPYTLDVDLGHAGISYHNGVYGTFRDVSTPSTVDGVQLWRGSNRIEAEYQNVQWTLGLDSLFNTSENVIASIQSEPEAPPNLTTHVLNAVHIPPSPSLLLYKEGILYNTRTKLYGSFETVGTVLFKRGTWKVVSLGDKHYLLQAGKVVLEANGGKTIDELGGHATENAFMTFLNAVKLPPSIPIERYLAKIDVVYDGAFYGLLKDMAKVLIEYERSHLYELGSTKRKRWYVKDREGADVMTPMLMLYGTNQLTLPTGSVSHDQGELIRRLIRLKRFKKLVPEDAAPEINVLVIPGVVITDYADLADNLPAVATAKTSTVNNMPYVHIDPDLDRFVSHTPGDVGHLVEQIPKVMLPKERVTFMISSQREIFGTSVREVEIVFPLAAAELVAALNRQRAPMPDVLVDAIQQGVDQAMAALDKHPDDLFKLDAGTRRIQRTTYELRTKIEQHNSRLHTSLEDKLEKVQDKTDMGSRFAALNMMRKLRHHT